MREVATVDSALTPYLFTWASSRHLLVPPLPPLDRGASEGALPHLPFGSPNSSLEEGGGQLVRPYLGGGRLSVTLNLPLLPRRPVLVFSIATKQGL